jgi:hypothetical protein
MLGGFNWVLTFYVFSNSSYFKIVLEMEFGFLSLGFNSGLDFQEPSSQFACTQRHRSGTCVKQRKLVAPDGKLWMRVGGLPSSSYFTNLVGSIINYARIKYVCRAVGCQVVDCRVQGDESVIKVNTMVRPDAYQIANKGERFGWVLGIF